MLSASLPSRPIRYLYSLQERGMKFGLANVRHLLAEVGNPQKNFRSIHVAGTNGKGSTCAFLASILMECGCSTGLYTSPHLVQFNERIRIDGRAIRDRTLASYVTRLRPMIEETGATFFEATTCIAFLHFAECGVDIAVIEAGLGGRLDATNVLTPMLSIITNVDLDHTEILGTTLQAIAKEKGGIIKQDVPCITGSKDRRVLNTLSRIAESRSAPLYRPEEILRSRCLTLKRGACVVSFSGKRVHARNASLGLFGVHQYRNSLIATSAIDLLLWRHPRSIPGYSSVALRRGLRLVSANSGIRGRFEILRRDKRVILDVAHNPGAAQTLIQAIKDIFQEKIVLVFGVMKDKDYSSMLGSLLSAASHVVAVRPRTERSLPAKMLRKELKRQGIVPYRGGTPARGLNIALRLAGRKGRVLVTGSHYVVGETIKAIEGRT